MNTLVSSVIVVVFFSLISFACNSVTPNYSNSKIIYQTEFTKKFKKEIERANNSAAQKISNRLGKTYKLVGNVYITIKNLEPKNGVNIGGTNSYNEGIGSIMIINYVDENLFNKLEHEFAHAIRNSNKLPKGHVKIHDNDFYNWSLSREYGE